MGLFQWGEKRFAKGIAKAMMHSYKMYKSHYPNLSEYELVKMTLSDRPGEPAADLLRGIQDKNTWINLGGNFLEITYILVRLEYVEYMRRSLDHENPKTNAIFRDTILREFRNDF